MQELQQPKRRLTVLLPIRVSIFVFLVTILIGIVPTSGKDEALQSEKGKTDSADTQFDFPHKPKPVAARDPKAIQAAIDRGIRFLLDDQNKTGSWGSAEKTTGLDIYAPVPGSHHAFRAAVTAMCISALIQVGGDSPEVQKSLDRAEAWLLENLPHVRRAEPMAIYNVWTHSYGISGLVDMLKRHPEDKERAAKIKQLIRDQIGMLERYESVDGGWGYYDFNAGTQKPASDGTSFCAATGLVALHDAKEIGIDAPQKLIDRAMASLRRQQKPDFSYFYGEYLKWKPMLGINRPGGSLGRSQVCNLALRLWGDKKITDTVLIDWLDRLFARNIWLEMGRKRPIPHESHFQVAGYFYYYGHYYASLCIDQLPTADRGTHYDQLTELMIKKQEKDGSWWDYPMYNYHQQYGTAFALMTLGYCRP
jgi:hypothetical protein